MANLRKYRDALRFIMSLVLFWLYIPHLLALFCCGRGRKKLVFSDINAMQSQLNIKLSGVLLLLYFLHNNRYYRSLFYFRIGPILSLLVGWYRPGDRCFIFSQTTKIGEGFWFAHPFSTVINAESIGKNFRCRHLTTVGKGDGKRPRIGDNVTCGVNVSIIGDITIGNNVLIGAGSVVVKSIPDNCVVAGVPAKIIKQYADSSSINLNQ